MKKIKSILISLLAVSIVTASFTGCAGFGANNTDSNNRSTAEKLDDYDEDDYDFEDDEDEDDEDDDKKNNKDEDDEDDDKSSKDEDEDSSKDEDDESSKDDKDDESSKDDEEDDESSNNDKPSGGNTVNVTLTNPVGTKNVVDCSDFEEYTVVDNSDLKVVLTEVDTKYEYYTTTTTKLTFKVTNNGSSDITFCDDICSINGFQTVSSLYKTVKPGETVETDCIFSDVANFDELYGEEFGDITSILIKFDVHDEVYNGIYTDYLLIYPEGKDKATLHRRDIQSNDYCAMDNEYMGVYVLDEFYDDIYGYCTTLYIVNNSDKTIYMHTENETVDGQEISPFFGVKLLPGECTYGSTDWFDDDDLTGDYSNGFEIKFDIILEEVIGEYDYDELDVENVTIKVEY